MDYLTRLAQRALGVTIDVPVAQPLIPSRFELAAETPNALTPIDETSDVTHMNDTRRSRRTDDAHSATKPQPAQQPRAESLLSPRSHEATPIEQTMQPTDEDASDAVLTIVTRRADAPLTVMQPAFRTEGAAASEITPIATRRRETRVAPATAPQPSTSEMFAEQAAPSEARAPIIRVTIGRVDVRALTTTPAPASPHKTPSKPSSPSLEDYLRGDHRR